MRRLLVLRGGATLAMVDRGEAEPPQAGNAEVTGPSPNKGKADTPQAEAATVSGPTSAGGFFQWNRRRAVGWRADIL